MAAKRVILTKMHAYKLDLSNVQSIDVTLTNFHEIIFIMVAAFSLKLFEFL